jgi:hypothetical protein
MSKALGEGRETVRISGSRSAPIPTVEEVVKQPLLSSSSVDSLLGGGRSPLPSIAELIKAAGENPSPPAEKR